MPHMHPRVFPYVLTVTHCLCLRRRNLVARTQRNRCIWDVSKSSVHQGAECNGGGRKKFRILQSVSTDVHENLALEDWIYERDDVQGRPALLVWRNRCCVVIGRHQNPWAECDVRLVRSRHATLARRRSGGGTVYHDLGNVNFTFFSSRTGYDRGSNLRLVVSALADAFPNLALAVSPRYDLLLDGRYKVSGTAAKVGGKVAYHHLTLLGSADTMAMSRLLKSSHTNGLHSHATASVPAQVRNLCDADNSVSCEALSFAITRYYATLHGDAQQIIEMVDPRDETTFPGIAKLQDELSGWEWIYGRTPEFTIEREWNVPGDGDEKQITFCLHIKRGRIQDCKLQVPIEWLPTNLLNMLIHSLIGVPFWPDNVFLALVNLKDTWKCTEEVKHNWEMLIRHIISVV
uniref:lipoyl amidotransferase LIPT1, mitochondrial n=1 Tax=Myxine glutinosa TaxID=7769 RepID=UPI00358FCCA0